MTMRPNPYIVQYDNKGHVFHKESIRIEQQLRTEATITDGVIRWDSNNQVPPLDIVEFAAYIGLPIDFDKSSLARDRDLDTFLADYRANYKGPTDEERFEARAAHGPGAKLVNVITGDSWTT